MFKTRYSKKNLQDTGCDRSVVLIKVSRYLDAMLLRQGQIIERRVSEDTERQVANPPLKRAASTGNLKNVSFNSNVTVHEISDDSNDDNDEPNENPNQFGGGDGNDSMDAPPNENPIRRRSIATQIILNRLGNDSMDAPPNENPIRRRSIATQMILNRLGIDSTEVQPNEDPIQRSPLK